MPQLQTERLHRVHHISGTNPCQTILRTLRDRCRRVASVSLERTTSRNEMPTHVPRTDQPTHPSVAGLQQDMNFPPSPTHNIPPPTESYASPTTRGSLSPCSSCFTPPNAFYTSPQTWCSEEDPTTPSSTLPSPPRHASCQHIQNESRVLFNQW